MRIRENNSKCLQKLKEKKAYLEECNTKAFDTKISVRTKFQSPTLYLRKLLILHLN